FQVFRIGRNVMRPFQATSQVGGKVKARGGMVLMRREQHFLHAFADHSGVEVRRRCASSARREWSASLTFEGVVAISGWYYVRCTVANPKLNADRRR
ncbi:MAG: hypothetical protein JWQ44_2877, partial [Chthoniobacter sp.]|nr:hypothetical protein [Chthoniobacter sp.]